METPLTKTKFRTQAIPEASSRRQIDTFLTAALAGESPGFILRRDSKTALDIKDHDDLVEFLRQALAKQGAHFTPGPTKTKVKPHGVGELHTDGVESVENVLNFNVHSTSRGSGDLLLALPGTSAKALIDAESRDKPGFGTLEVRSVWEKPLHDLALTGETFAELINPNKIFMGKVSEGDSVVIALESQKGPMFHRFDTDAVDREALITELHRLE